MKKRDFFKKLLLTIAILIGAFHGNLFAQPPENVGLDRAIEVQEKYNNALMARDGIEGTGIGYDDNGQLAIKVFTATAGLPGIPDKLENVPVKAVVTGKFMARTDYTARFPWPVPIGVSTGHPDITAGTIGCRVTDGANVYALSNNHVYANGNAALIGDYVLQPGPYDGGSYPGDAIGTLYDYVEILFNGPDNYVDAAIALTSTEELGVSTPGEVSLDGYGIPSMDTKQPTLTMAVQKCGRTTGWTQGQVAEINVTVDVCYETSGPFRCKKYARFVGQFTVEDGTFSAGGDSGSLIVTGDGGNNPVGLLFAGSDTRTIANPIDTVLSAFGVWIDDGSDSTVTNAPPTANFTFNTSDLTVSFTDQSTDDGTIVSWNWDFGDSGSSTAQNPTHTYTASGTYKVTLTVTDDDGAKDTATDSVTVTDSSVGITLTATGYKIKGRQKADLLWSGATSTSVDIYRGGAIIATTKNDGSYTDNIDNVGGGLYVYQVCEVGTNTCSNEATVQF